MLAATIRVDVVGEVPDGDLAGLASDAERMVRAAEAYRCEVLGEIERRGLHAEPGHRDIAEYARGVHRMAPRESRDTKRLARLIRAHPVVGERMSLGLLGVAQARLLASAFAHPRAGSKLSDFLPMFFEFAAGRDFVEFEEIVRAWRSRADQDGASGAFASAAECVDLAVGEVPPDADERPGDRCRGGGLDQMAPMPLAWRFWMASPMRVSDSTVRNRAPPGTSTG